MASNVIIPVKHYVGLIKRENSKLPLAFITPWGEDSAAKKRIDTVNTWAGNTRNWRGHTQLESQIIENVPLIGFKLGESIRSSGYGGYDKWRIEDPRGFELEITSGNLAQILSVGMIDKGEIMDQCVWARFGKDNILLSTNTNEYKQAVENTKVARSTASWKDVKLGDAVVLQNNIKGIWLGRMHYLFKNYSYVKPSTTERIGQDEMSCPTKLVHIIFDGKSTVYLLASPNLSSFDHCETPLTKAQAEVHANELISNKNIKVDKQGYTTPLIVAFDIMKPASHYTLKLVDLNIQHKNELTRDNTTFIEMKNGDFGSSSHRDVIYCYDRASIDQNKLCRKMGPPDRKNSWGMSAAYYGYEALSATFNFASVDKFYSLELTVKTSTGNEISRLI